MDTSEDRLRNEYRLWRPNGLVKPVVPKVCVAYPFASRIAWDPRPLPRRSVDTFM